MDTNEAEVIMTHEEHIDNRMSNNLDLNVEHDCNRSPKSSNVNGDPSGSSSKLKLGTEFESDEQAHAFYHKYAELAGFGVRKDWVNRSKVHGRVMSRKFTCSRQGHRKKDKRDINVKKHRKETRTGCLAHMVITRQPNGKYLVTQYEAEHNHEDVNLTKAEELLILPLSGKTDSNEASETESMKNSEIKSKLSLQLLGLRFCPPENFDDFQTNDDIFLKSGRTRDMNEGDAARLVYYFNRQHFVNPSFFYSLQLDIDDKVSNIFWADDNMISEYGHFGDVVCLDTSCVRNTNSRPYVQFVGLNNHRHVVIFGAAFLYDDSVDSFKWLVRTFIETMSGKKPKFILSDQDATVVQAIHAVLPETSHCICAWQLYLIALKHLRRAVKEYDSFASDFRSCIFGHEHEDDFVRAWDFMLDKHGLCNNAWLKWMFREKEKWAVAYGRNTFFVERDETHLVELLADKLRSYLSPDIDVLHFFKHFESVVNEQRYSELESTLEMEKRAPVLMANAILLKHPSETYTPSAFEVFQREYEKCLNVVINKCGERNSRIDYKAKTYEKSRDFSVLFNSLDRTVSCNCMKFEHVGFLCSHALKVLDQQNIKIVPSYYILSRWTRDARVLPAVENNVYAEDDNRNIMATRYKDLCRDIIKISARAAVSDPAFEFASRQLNGVMQGIEKILSFKSFDEGKGVCGADNGLDGVDIDENEFECPDVDDVLKGSGETESMVPNKDQLDCCDVQFPSSSGGLSVRSSLPETVLSVACAPSTYISSPSPTPSLSPLTQGLYTIEANQMVQSMYQASNLTINQQSNPNMYDPNFYSNQHHSPSHAQFLQFQDPMSNGTAQLKPVESDIAKVATESKTNSTILFKGRDLMPMNFASERIFSASTLHSSNVRGMNQTR
ncbi:protein far1-related sequence 5 [Phtheirospermum japonicum]|uniref:Protein FAR1-RELATED SEQUENCE n=1 Tax=Phtheirospermum japonicum TaxID=374723 RepID=A0A830BLP7_9LAMI|nr:protein far1-related sequence 5 [Phtheirospermum japonicum]